MAEMTEEEADALDELLTKTTPKVNPSVQTPDEIIHELVSKEIAASA